MANAPARGRNTNGGLEMTSKPFSVAATGVGLMDGVVVASGVGEGDALGLGDGNGEVVAASRVKLAHGFGATLAQSLWTPGVSPAKGLMWGALKLPFWSAMAEPWTLLGGSRERKALVGMGVGDGEGHGEELAVPHSALASGAMTNRTEAEARAARMTMAGFNRRFRGPREFKIG